MAIEEIEIEGYLGQNPKYSNEKYPDMLTFSVGVSQSFKAKDSDIRESRTTWYDVVCYDKNKSTYLTGKLFKGDKVIVKGKPSLKTWVAKDGKSNATISIVLTKIALMKKVEDHREPIALNESPHFATATSPSQMENYYDNQTVYTPTMDRNEIPF